MLRSLYVLYLQAQTRVSGAGEAEEGGEEDASAEDRQRQLTAELRLAKEELFAAQELAAAAQGHAKQFEALAASSDEALKAIRVRPLPFHPL